MLFVPEVESYLKYLYSRNNFQKSDKDRLRQNIFETKNNLIVFNVDFVNAIEEIIDVDHELRDVSNQFIKKIIDNIGEISLKAEVKSDTTRSDLIFAQLCKTKTYDDIVIGLSEDKDGIDGFDKVLNLSNVYRGNKNYIFSKLLTNEVCLVRHSDYNSRQDIISTFETIFKIYDKLEIVNIIDRYVNLNHNLYNYLIQASPQINYFTLRADGSSNISLKRKFQKYQIYNTNNPDHIHERSIIITDLIVTIDEDPMYLEHRDTWTITMQISPELSNEIIEKKKQIFQKTLYKK